MEKEWYVIHTYSGHENKVKLAIEKKVKNLGLEEKIEKVVVSFVRSFSLQRTSVFAYVVVLLLFVLMALSTLFVDAS